MSTKFLLPPREAEEPFSFIHFLLSEFQEEIEYQLETFSQRASAGKQHMQAQWRSVAASAGAGAGSTVSSDLDREQQKEWIRVTTEWCAATEWLRLHGNVAELILNGDFAQIDVSHPEVQPLWRRFAEQKRPQWATQWEALCKFSGWPEDLTSSAMDSPEPLPFMAEPAGVNQSPFYDLPNHEFKERYPARAEDEPFKDGYEHEEGEADEKYASATPDALSPDVSESSSIAVPEKPIPPVPITQLVARHLHPFLHRLIKRICARFCFNINEISVVARDNEAWQILKSEESGVPVPEDELDVQATLMPIRAQKALLEVFKWAEHRGIQDELKIEEEFLGAFLPSYAPEIHDFDRRSNGVSRIVAGEIEYEGGSEMPNHGFSVQSESRIIRPFDRD